MAMAYGSTMPGSIRSRAARTRTRVSWTRSSAAGWRAHAGGHDPAEHRDEVGDVAVLILLPDPLVGCRLLGHAADPRRAVGREGRS